VHVCEAVRYVNVFPCCVYAHTLTPYISVMTLCFWHLSHRRRLPCV